jgi:hypothetical protein
MVGYDVALDGRSFYTVQALPAAPAPPVTHVRVVRNWLEEVRARVQAAKAR